MFFVMALLVGALYAAAFYLLLARSTLKLIFLEDIPIHPNIHPTPRTKFSQHAKYCSIIPSIRFTFKFFNQGFYCSSNTTPNVALKKSEKL